MGYAREVIGAFEADGLPVIGLTYEEKVKLWAFAFPTRRGNVFVGLSDILPGTLLVSVIVRQESVGIREFDLPDEGDGPREERVLALAKKVMDHLCESLSKVGMVQ
ncbi:MAG: hypothetical protein LBF40_03490 [Deltaproteobacteria bacterium]|jgi:hypothetical protein|nr:hypothetical protein [Deltaproteobacteria bacterium]